MNSWKSPKHNSFFILLTYFVGGGSQVGCVFEKSFKAFGFVFFAMTFFAEKFSNQYVSTAQDYQQTNNTKKDEGPFWH